MKITITPGQLPKNLSLQNVADHINKYISITVFNNSGQSRRTEDGKAVVMEELASLRKIGVE